MEHTAVDINNLGIRFFLKEEKSPDGMGKSLFSRRKKQEFWALRNISFEIKRREIFGIIGANGAGKSTLLKIIAGIYPPTEGNVHYKGTLVPLIELGAAFNPELTGAENIYLTGSIFRVPRRVIAENFNKIVEFSGLKKFINSPLKNYSSGMFIRLAFSIVIFFEPDIVLIDEVFSVGDQVFQQKSFERILSFKEKGSTIVLVTHDLSTVSQICSKVMVLDQGRIAYLGPPQKAIDHYMQLMSSPQSLDSRIEESSLDKTAQSSQRWGSKEVRITAVDFVDEKGEKKNTFNSGEYFEAQISYESRLKDKQPVFGAAISTVYKLLIYGPNTLEKKFDRIPQKGTVRFIIPSLPLFRGDYLFSASAYDSSLNQAYDHHEMMYHFRVLEQESRSIGCVRLDSDWKIQSD